MIGWMAYFISLVAVSQILLWGRISSEVPFLTFPLTYFLSNFCLFYNSYSKAVWVRETRRKRTQGVIYNHCWTQRGGGTNAQVRLGTFANLCCPLWVDAKDRQSAPTQLAPWSPWGCFWVRPCALECAERRDADVFRLTWICSFWRVIYLWE